MKRCCVILVLAIASATLAGDADRKALNGSWKPVAAELAGAKFPQEELDKITLKIDGDKYTVEVGKAIDKGTAKSDASAKPKSMDITGTEGPNKGKTLLAIYEIDKDTLRICYDLKGKERPTEFSSSKEKPYFLVTYKRSK
jgi:uncharacterized protein (TIGR03067 family)